MFSNDIKSKEKCVNVILSRKMQQIVCRTHTCHHRLKESGIVSDFSFLLLSACVNVFTISMCFFCNKENNQIGGRRSLES